MDKFPLMIFRAPGSELVHGVKCETCVVQDDDELEGALADGWHLSATEAGAALEKARSDAEAAAMAELEQLKAQQAEAAAQAIRQPLLEQIESLKADNTALRGHNEAMQKELNALRAKAAPPKPSEADEKPAEEKAAAKPGKAKA